MLFDIAVRLFVLSLVLPWHTRASCSRDTSTVLPLPSFPSQAYSGYVPPPLSHTMNHWSQVSIMMRPPNAIQSTQRNCPHMDPSLKDWHDPSIWTNSIVPLNGSAVTIPANTSVLISSCSIPSSYIFQTVTIPSGSALVFSDALITFQASGMNVLGTLSIGSPTCRLRNKVTITLHGARANQPLPTDPFVKGIATSSGGGIDIHGVEYFPTWTRLSTTAYPGNTTIFIQDCPNWQPGQSIAITTTELKDSRDWHRNEEALIEVVQTTTISSTVCAVLLQGPIKYLHYGGPEYQAEVALLSRNILIQGDPFHSEPTDTSPIACKYGPSPSTYPCDNTFSTGFGAHVIVQAGSAFGRFSGIELYRVGQTNQLGRYPLHFHQIGSVSTPGLFFISDCSVHHSFFKCYTIHGTSGTTLDNGISIIKSTGYDVIGHCFFASEDGVEENHTIAYNLAALVHPIGPFWQASYGVSFGSNVAKNPSGSQSFYSQYTDYVSGTAEMVRVDDLTASPFYFTNAYSAIYGNAASGGWSGYSFPNLPAPIGNHADVKMVPKNRPLLLFQGNTAHSTGYWQGHASGVYLGGNLVLDNSGVQQYTAGRYLPARDTCLDDTQSCPAARQSWLRITDTKIFLANVGLQSWGNREELIRYEVHDVGLSTNVFGQVWIDQMLVNCRSNNTLTFLQGCNASWWACNVRDYSFFRSYTGFQFYDTGQSHLVTNTIFQNCKPQRPNSIPGSDYSVTVWSYLTHSDQFTPGLMQMTKNITYINTDMNYLMRPTTSAASRITVSGRDANWLDADGTVTPFFPQGTRVSIGSNWTGPDWWRLNDRCVNSQDNWVCPMDPADDIVSLVIHWAPSSQENQIGSSYCSNGASGPNNSYLPCPVGAVVTHFGRSEANGFKVGLMGRVTGPVIASSGGWFIRFLNGPPAKLSFSEFQIAHSTILHIAIPYPTNTIFSIYAQAPSWCNPGNPPKPWSPLCQHFYHSVSDLTDLRSSWGDTYYYDQSSQLLHLRLVSLDSFPGNFGTNATYLTSRAWNSSSTHSNYFSRGGLNLLVTGSSAYSIVIEATNCQGNCPDLPSAQVPGANGYLNGDDYNTAHSILSQLFSSFLLLSAGMVLHFFY